MNRLQKLVGIGAVALSSLTLSAGGNESRHEPLESKPETGNYFASLSLQHSLSTAAVAITSGDFNRDGNLDVVLANLDDNGTRLYFFEGDGKGNFKLKTYPK